MAALAIPAIEFIGGRLLTWIGGAAIAGGAGALAGQAAKSRQEAAAEARTSPIAKTDAATKSKEKCKECPPDKGTPTLHNTVGWSEDSIAYQRRIAQMPPGPPGYLTEWKFRDAEFDGFDSGQCRLKEAKAGFDQFFYDDSNEVKAFFGGFDRMLDQLRRQATAANPRPPVKLSWYFMEPKSHRYFSRMARAAYPDVEFLFQP